MANFEYDGKEYDLDDLNEALARDFWQAFGDTFGSDEPAKRETFHNWTDGLCKGGVLCDAGYDQCDLIYSANEAHGRGWIL